MQFRIRRRSVVKRIRLFALLPGFLLPFFAGYSVAADWDYQTRRLFYGTYIGVDLGIINQYEVSLLAGYKILPRWHAGIGGKYLYHYEKTVGNVFGAHLFGPAAFSDLIIIKDLDELFPFRFIKGALFLHAEADLFSLPVRYFDHNSEHSGKNRFFEPVWLAGAGLRRQAGSHSYFHILLMMDLSGRSSIIYSNPVLRFGFMF